MPLLNNNTNTMQINKIYNPVRTIPKSNIKIVDRSKIDTLLTHKYMTAHFSWLVTHTSIKSYTHFNKKLLTLQ